MAWDNYKFMSSSYHMQHTGISSKQTPPVICKCVPLKLMKTTLTHWFAQRGASSCWFTCFNYTLSFSSGNYCWKLMIYSFYYIASFFCLWHTISTIIFFLQHSDRQTHFTTWGFFNSFTTLLFTGAFPDTSIAFVALQQAGQFYNRSGLRLFSENDQ